jgi:short-subunit dehydrogenase
VQPSGRTVIVTGASSGIGREAAREFCKRGSNVVLASRSKDILENIASDFVSYPGRTLIVPTDVTDRLAVEALMRKSAEEFGSIDVLINNAGVGLFAPIGDGNIDNARYLFEVNVWGAVNAIQAAIPYMQDQQRGHIVNISSVAGHIAPPYMGMYAASKHALHAISNSLRIEQAGDSIGVTTVYPGLTETAFTENMLQEIDAPEIPPIVRWTPAEHVGKRIYQAVRWNIRDVYISPEDVVAVFADAFAGPLSDWAMRYFMKPGQRNDVRFKPAKKSAESSEASG